MVRNEGDRIRRVVMCTPTTEYFSVDDIEFHNINEVADPELTRRQHDRLKAIFEETGTEVIDVPELAGHPNSVFTRDVSLVTPEGYIVVRMGLPSRRGEEQWMSGILESMGVPCAGEITDPGTLEGGDVILAGPVAFVGNSCRSNEEGTAQLTSILSGMDYEVRVAPVDDDYMHIGGVMSSIGPRRVVCCRELFPQGFFEDFDTVDIDYKCPSSGNVICLGENEVVANAAENKATIAALEKKGVMVHEIDLGEFRKGAGGPSCLTLPLERG